MRQRLNPTAKDAAPPREWRGRTALVAVGVIGIVAIVASCSSASDGTPSPSSSEEVTGTSLTVTVNNKERTDEWTVTCDPDGGTHPDPNQVCNFLDLSKQWGKDPFAPVEADRVCTQVYGGPETATVTGTWDGEPVDAEFNRTNGCEITRWSTALPILVVEGAPPSDDQPR